MKIGNALAASAITGILLSINGCGGDAKPAADPSTTGAKASCSAGHTGADHCNGAAAPASSAAPAASGKASCSGKGSCSAAK